MKNIKISISEIKPNPNNPRFIKDDKFNKLVKSIKDFPKMLEIRPIIVDENMMILGGNMRLKACKEIGIETIFITQVKELSDSQKNEFIIKDNTSYGEWDFDILNLDYDVDALLEWGIENFDANDFNGSAVSMTHDEEEYYAINVEFANENEQNIFYDELIERGIKCKIVS